MPDVVAEGLPILIQALDAVGYVKYILVFFGALFEGPVLTVVSGFLLHADTFDLRLLFLALALGDLAGDTVWYCIGRWFARPVLERHGRFLTLTPEAFESLSARFHRHHSLILFTSKITMGFGMALGMLMAAGAARIPFRAYLFWNALGEIVYVSALLALGYFFGELYSTIAAGLKTVFVIFASVVVLAGLYLISSRLRSKALEDSKTLEQK